MTSTRVHRLTSLEIWWALSILIVAVQLRFLGLEERWLWLDELMTVNWSVHGVWPALVNAVRFDTHPPLYYLQLSVWALFGNSDYWLMVNTVMWSAATVALLAYTASRLYGTRVGLSAGLLLALCPAALAYADHVRMYSFTTFLVVGAWYALERWLEGGIARFGSIRFVLWQILVIYSHSAGVVMLCGLVLYGAARVLLTGQRAIIVKWFLLECVVGLLALPAIAIAVVRGMVHPVVSNADVFLNTWGFLTTGDLSVTTTAWVVVFSAAFAVLLVIFSAFDRRIRLQLATLVLAPFVVAAIVSFSFKPIWLTRLFLPILPFMCLGLARGAAAEHKSRKLAILGTVLFVLVAGSWGTIGTYQQLVREKGDGYKPSAEFAQLIAEDGDTVLVDGTVTYWCFMWYFVGPNWGEPRHAFINTADWERLMNRLPQSVPDWLGLNSSAAMIRSGNVTAMLWDRTKPVPGGLGDLIVVRHQVSDQVSFPDRHLVSRAHNQQILVERWAR